ncbi:hypothetical protein B1H58_14565 [Pantoea alhagi]|uniref:Uncharacterized protein n=1 Tax=Pantoea alhagi TaxID=1891675 RepID=A0A1W6B7S5_9GAMM|nr:glycosyltransferase [Pantoea alhagi]ARJ43131.1 hypothetical protein B1H58_14565 [Pantoea alhagi]
MRILYTGAFRYPDKDAAGKRVNNIINCLVMSDSIKDIFVAGWEQKEDKNFIPGEKVTHESFSILDKKNNSKIRKVINFAFQGHSLLKWFYNKRHFFDIIILYNPPAFFAALMLIMGKIFNKKLILDSTEWYESEHLPGGRYGMASLENYIRMRYVYPRFKNVMAISSFLEKYYLRCGVKNVIRVPPLAVKSPISFVKSKNELHSELSLLYAGSPGRKDRLDELVYKIINTKNKINESVILHIAGITEEQFYQTSPELKYYQAKIASFVKFYGRIPMSEVLELYRKIDYCIFIRENKRYALAGFPSKVVESLSTDTPIITNPVGDIDEILPHIGIAIDMNKDNIDEELQRAIAKRSDFHGNLTAIFNDNFSVESKKYLIENFIVEKLL